MSAFGLSLSPGCDGDAPIDALLFVIFSLGFQDTFTIHRLGVGVGNDRRTLSSASDFGLGSGSPQFRLAIPFWLAQTYSSRGGARRHIRVCW